MQRPHPGVEVLVIPCSREGLLKQWSLISVSVAAEKSDSIQDDWEALIRDSTAHLHIREGVRKVTLKIVCHKSGQFTRSSCW